MKITNIELYSGDIEIATFELGGNTTESPYLLRAVVGLDADEIVPKFYGFGMNSDSKLYSFSMKARDIVMRILLNPALEIRRTNADLRDNLYKAISRTRRGAVELRFNNAGIPVAHISGFITKFEVPHFSKTAEVQITVRCDDPIFRSMESIIIHQDDSPSGLEPLVIANSIANAPQGLVMEFLCLADTPDFTLNDYTDAQSDPDWEFKVVPGTIGASTGFKANDVLHIDSDDAKRELYIVRASVVYHLASKVQPTSVWPIMFPGNNKYLITDATKFQLVYAEYVPSFWGI